MTVTDSTGRELIFKAPPQKIVSLCPSVTQTIADLGRAKWLSGVTDYCPLPLTNLHPIKLGGPKKPSLEKIYLLQPDLVIFIEEENTLSDYMLVSEHFRTMALRINSIKDSLQMIETIGTLLQSKKEASEYIFLIGEELGLVPEEEVGYYYFVWKDPYILAGKQTYTDSFLAEFGFKNLVNETSYPATGLKKLNETPGVVFFPDEPFRFNLRNSLAVRRHFPLSTYTFIDGRICTWFGTSTLKGIKGFKRLISNFKKESR